MPQLRKDRAGPTRAGNTRVVAAVCAACAATLTITLAVVYGVKSGHSNILGGLSVAGDQVYG